MLTIWSLALYVIEKLWSTHNLIYDCRDLLIDWVTFIYTFI